MQTVEGQARTMVLALEHKIEKKLDSRMKDFESYFPERLRPAIYAWAMQKDKVSRADVLELQWFMNQLVEMEQEQHSVLKSVPFVGRFFQQVWFCSWT